MSLCKRTNLFLQVNTDNVNRFAIPRTEENSRYYDMFIISANFASYEYLNSIGPIFEVTIDKDYAKVEIIKYRPCSSIKCSKMALLELYLFYLHTVENYPNDHFCSKFNPLRSYNFASNLFEFVGLIGVNLYSHALSLEQDFHFISTNPFTTHQTATLVRDYRTKHENFFMIKWVDTQFDQVVENTSLSATSETCSACHNELEDASSDPVFVDVSTNMNMDIVIPSNLKMSFVDGMAVILPYSGKCLDQEYVVSYMTLVLTAIAARCSGDVSVFEQLPDDLVFPVDLSNFASNIRLHESDVNEEEFYQVIKNRNCYFEHKMANLPSLINEFSRFSKLVTSIHGLFTPKL